MYQQQQLPEANMKPAPTKITIQIHCSQNCYRFVGPHGPSHANVSKREIEKIIKFVYGDNVEIRQEIANFPINW